MEPTARRTVIGAALLLALLFLCSSCGPARSVRYTLAIAKGEHGSVVPASGSKYSAGTIVTLVAIPDPGWLFVSWQGASGTQVVDNRIAMDGNKVVQAVFEPAAYSLTVTVQGEGTVSQDEIAAKSMSYANRSKVRLTPVARQGWVFSGWRGADAADLDGNQITMTGNKTVTAVFEQLIYPLTVTVEGEGTVQQALKSTMGTGYTDASLVVLTPVPSPGWVFSAWRGRNGYEVLGGEIVMNGSKAVTAVFEQAE